MAEGNVQRTVPIGEWLMEDKETQGGGRLKNKRPRPTAVFAPAAARLQWRTDPDLPRRISRVAGREVRCGNTGCRCGKTRPLWWQEQREPQREAAASLVSCHYRGLVLPQQTSCVVIAHLSSRHTRDPSHRLSPTSYVLMFLQALVPGHWSWLWSLLWGQFDVRS